MAKRSWSECHEELFAYDDACCYAPPKQWELNIAGHLFERGYDVADIRRVLDFATTYGTVECCPVLMFDDGDRAKVEAYLPECPQWDRPEYTIERYAITEEAMSDCIPW